MAIPQISTTVRVSESWLRQRRQENRGVSQIYKFQKLGDLVPIIREMQDHRVFVAYGLMSGSAVLVACIYTYARPQLAPLFQPSLLDQAEV